MKETRFVYFFTSGFWKYNLLMCSCASKGSFVYDASGFSCLTKKKKKHYYAYIIINIIKKCFQPMNDINGRLHCNIKMTLTFFLSIKTSNIIL